MHADEVDIDAALVRRLLRSQLPHWAELPIAPVSSAGTDNALYRLGDELVVRLPRVASATGQVNAEHRWLPQLAPLLPLAIPEPLAAGEPGEGYPWHWSVYRWLDGDDAAAAPVADPHQAAQTLAVFVAAMRRVDLGNGPPARRGWPLRLADKPTRAAIDALAGVVDGRAATAAWDGALDAPAWQGPPMWVHGDLHGTNLIVRDGRISAVVDFGGVGVGDPACDLMVAWTYLDATTRPMFRDALDCDDATWARGRGWALQLGVLALPYYRDTNPVFAAIARHAIDEVLADHANDR